MRLIFFRPWAWHYGHMHGRGPWKGYGRYWGPPPWAHEGEEGEAATAEGAEGAAEGGEAPAAAEDGESKE